MKIFWDFLNFKFLVISSVFISLVLAIFSSEISISFALSDGTKWWMDLVAMAIPGVLAVIIAVDDWIFFNPPRTKDN